MLAVSGNRIGDVSVSKPSGRLTMSTFVDNLFVAGRSCNAVSKIFDDVEEFLNTEWGFVSSVQVAKFWQREGLRMYQSATTQNGLSWNL